MAGKNVYFLNFVLLGTGCVETLRAPAEKIKWGSMVLIDQSELRYRSVKYRRIPVLALPAKV